MIRAAQNIIRVPAYSRLFQNIWDLTLPLQLHPPKQSHGRFSSKPKKELRKYCYFTQHCLKFRSTPEGFCQKTASKYLKFSEWQAAHYI